MGVWGPPLRGRQGVQTEGALGPRSARSPRAAGAPRLLPPTAPPGGRATPPLPESAPLRPHGHAPKGPPLYIRPRPFPPLLARPSGLPPGAPGARVSRLAPPRAVWVSVRQGKPSGPAAAAAGPGFRADPAGSGERPLGRGPRWGGLGAPRDARR